MKQIHLAIRNKYILQFETNAFQNFRQIHCSIWDHYFLPFETNTFGNLRQIHLAIWDKYILQFENILTNWDKYICNLKNEEEKNVLKFDRYAILQLEPNKFCNLRQITYAIPNQYILPIARNTFYNLRQIHLQFCTNALYNLMIAYFVIWDKYIFFGNNNVQIETFIFSNLRQIHFAICDN